MIKILRNISFVLLTSLVFFGCEEEVTTYSGAEFVRFSISGETVQENNTEAIFTVPIHIVGNAPSSDVQLTITTSGTAVEGTDFEFVSTSNPTIPAGDYFTEVSFRVFDNLEASGSKIVSLVISDAGSYEVGYGGDSTDYAIGEAYNIVIQDDDCVLDIDMFGSATYTAEELGYGVYDSEVLIDPDNENALIITNLGDWGGLDAYFDFDPDVTTSVITIRKTPTGYTSGGETLYWQGTGTYVACEGSFTADYSLAFDDGTPAAGASVVYTPN